MSGSPYNDILDLAEHLWSLAGPSGRSADLRNERPGLTRFSAKLVNDIDDVWQRALCCLSPTSTKPVLGHLQWWFDQRCRTIQDAVDTQRALPSDVLLLGIVPLNLTLILEQLRVVDVYHNDLMVRAREHIHKVRNLVRDVAPNPERAGWESHIKDRVNNFRLALKPRHQAPRAEAHVESWIHESLNELPQETFGGYPLLVQWAIAEVLHQLLQTVLAMADSGRHADATELLDSWPMKRIVNRALDTFEAANRCTISPAMHSPTLEMATSNLHDPTFFHPLPLPCMPTLPHMAAGYDLPPPPELNRPYAPALPPPPPPPSYLRPQAFPPPTPTIHHASHPSFAPSQSSAVRLPPISTLPFDGHRGVAPYAPQPAYAPHDLAAYHYGSRAHQGRSDQHSLGSERWMGRPAARKYGVGNAV
ncbi:hypothetical protein JCM10908_005963 [Rhodotorula pacifica]|uniref:uncharacterized protein n=1 Tax=Rhodotorula pacifica TaxID=1495444 RepID=UPI003171450A